MGYYSLNFQVNRKGFVIMKDFPILFLEQMYRDFDDLLEDDYGNNKYGNDDDNKYK